ncbi:MAG: TIGR03808 family TAT-translocated repetitive protein [Rhizobiales bacterium]|nr:TIGR03808 family TAT-translocated repetitive protein [Hyphomicrobiales bacterium]MBA68071.1 TIGR03808 family TAT-translocated repetitive protein [Hyphomicrobiales bacterium]
MTRAIRLSRRSLLGGALAAGLAMPARSAQAAGGLFTDVGLRGGHDADLAGLLPDTADDQSRDLQEAIDSSAKAGRILRLPAGDFHFSNLTLRDGTRMAGVPGATRLVYTGRGHGLLAETGSSVRLEGLTVDGANQQLGEHVRGLVHLRSVEQVFLDDVTVTGSARDGLVIEGCGGRIERCDISGAADAGIFAVGSRELAISGNFVHDCGNGGILVHRWTPGPDGTIVSGNRVARISARSGGTGQFGNGINLFRAGDVTVSDNHVSDCAFSAIRANSASNVQIVSNKALRSGETALYSEFAFEGALISGNLVDGGTMGISVANFASGGRLAVISGNLIRNLSADGPYEQTNSGFGIGIAVEADATVSGNTIEGAPKWGMMVGWGPYLRDLAITGNVIRDAGLGMAVTVVEGAGKALISDNVFSDTPGGAIVGTRWNEAVTGDMAKTGASAWPHLTVERNAVG